MTQIDPDPRLNHAESAARSADSMDPGLTRRRLLKFGAQGALLVGGASFLAACGSSGTGATVGGGGTAPSLPTTSGGGHPVLGGTLTVGGITGGTSETLNPILASTFIDVLSLLQIFERLFTVNPDLKSVVPQLALSAEPNKDYTVWKLNLRKGVKWHDGSAFTADDVVYSILKWWANPSGYGAFATTNIDLKNVRSRGANTVEIPLLTPDAQFPFTTLSYTNAIVKSGAKPSEFTGTPVGTGPFKVVSFKRGQQRVFEANKEYWEAGKPYLDTLTFDTSFADDTTRLNALRSGQIDLMPFASPLSAKAEMSDSSLTVFGSPSPQPNAFAMRVDEGPYSDVRVRQAMKLLVDRQALIDGALAGFAVPAVDLLGEGSTYFADSFKPVHDPEKAKSLFKAAGMEGETFVLQTAPVAPGQVEAATLFAQQAKAAGINIEIKQEQQGVYFTTPGGYLSTNLRQDTFIPYPSLDLNYRALLTDPGKNFLNETYWGAQKPGGPAAQKHLAEALAATDKSKANDLWHQVQTEQVEEGGLLVWANSYFLHIAAPSVKNITESPAGFLNNSRMLEGWTAG